MKEDGKQLEHLVGFVEKLHLPEGFEVKTNERVVNDEGVQIAEFDIEIKGKVGTTSISWLIECRDRPGAGAAPGSWVEQLVGRRTRFGFNKVTAVSTTGFASGAIDFARQQGIELREVSSLDPVEFKDWLQISTMTQRRRIADLHHANIKVATSESTARKRAALKAIRVANGADALLVSSETAEKVTPAQAFLGAIQATPNAFDNVKPGRPKSVRVVGNYPDQSHFLVNTAKGKVRVEAIEFIGELRVEEDLYPVIKTVEYRHVETGEIISQSATFAPQSVLGHNLSLELHHIASSGLTHVAIRKLPETK